MDITLGRAISDLRYNYPSMAIMYLRVTSAKMVYVSAVPFRKRWHLFYFEGVLIMEFKEAVAIRIKTLLEERQMSVEELAEKTELPVKTVRKILDCGYKKIGAEKVFIICYALNMPMSKFYDDEIFSAF